MNWELPEFLHTNTRQVTFDQEGYTTEDSEKENVLAPGGPAGGNDSRSQTAESEFRQ